VTQDIRSIRPSPIAGKWYRDNPVSLRAEILSYLDIKNQKIDGEVKGIIAPHAGYRYSGKTAGFAFQPVVGQDFDLVVVFSPFHAYHPAPLLSTKHEAYATPLGAVPVDHQLLNSFRQDYEKIFNTSLVQLANDGEHSLEIELPFLQCGLKPGFKLLPFMIRTIEPGFTKRIADILFTKIQKKRVLVVASTDLSHFYPEKEANQYDATMLAAFEAMNAEKIYEIEQNQKGFACGAGAVMAAVELTKKMGADKVQILHHTTSAEETGDMLSVVGYGAAVILQTQQQGV
jgi:AmmeMemoRadiSam system protein B